MFEGTIANRACGTFPQDARWVSRVSAERFGRLRMLSGSSSRGQRARLDRSIRRHRRAELEKGAAQLGVPVRSDWKKADLVRAIADELLRPSFVISPDARRVANAHRGTTDSDTVTVCDILGSNRVRVAPGGFVSAVAFDPSSRYLCTAVGTEVELWECDAEGTLRLLHCENDVGTLAFSRDGRYLIAAPEKRFPDINANPELWDIARGERLEAPAERELSELLSAARNPWKLAGPDNNLVAERKEPSRTVRVHAHDSRGGQGCSSGTRAGFSVPPWDRPTCSRPALTSPLTSGMPDTAGSWRS